MVDACCPKCGNKTFTKSEIESEGWIDRIPVIICDRCGAIICIDPFGIKEEIDLIRNTTGRIEMEIKK
jgi:hypothetical protein